MNITNGNSMWVMLYKNRLSFIDKSVDEFIMDINYESLLDGIANNKFEIYKIITKKFQGQAIQLEKVIEEELESLQKKLEFNENKFINELNIQDEISEKIKVLKEERKILEKIVNDEKVKLSNGLEKILNHLDNTIDKIKEKGIESILDRKGFKVVELIQCFKKNLYKYFVKSILNLKNPSCEVYVEIIIENKIRKEIDMLESDLTKYLFEKYISESQWIIIIEIAKKHSREYIDICKKYGLEASLIVKRELNNRIKSLNELLKNSLYKVEEIKKQRCSMERKLSEVNTKYENLRVDNGDETNKLNSFKELIISNYINEYNKIVNLINSKYTLNKDIKTYCEYLYLITSEMEKVEEELYG